ncbi:MAG: post-COAP-1 domain-containing protein [Nitrososphaerales archaeon]
MQIKIASVIVLTVLVGASLFAALPYVFASSPTSGTITTSSRTLTWSGSTTTANPTIGLATSFDPTTCQTLGYCDVFTISLNIPSDLSSTYPTYFLNITITWGNPNYDYDMYVYYNGNAVGSSTLGSGSSYENVFLNNPAPGTYQVYTTNWAVPPGYIYNGNATLGLSQPPYSFVTRSATYNIDSSSKTSGTPFTMTNDLRLVGAQNGGCVVLCAQDVEPSIKIDQFGTIYASAIEGVPAGTDFWKSTDGGQSFQYLGEPDGAQSPTVNQQVFGGIGGGDDDLALGSPFVLLNQSSNVVINSTGRIYLSSLSLASVTVASSFNGGSNWLSTQTDFPADDRQWTAATGASTYYLSFNELVSEVAGVTNLVMLQSNDGGATFTNGAYIGKALGGNLSNFQGPITIAPDGTLYGVFVPPSTNQIMMFSCPAPCSLPSLPLSTTSSPFNVRLAFDGPSNMTTDNVFPQLAVDSSGNIYIAWSTGRNIYLIGSSDGGNSWTAPVRVNAGDSNTALEPWLVAGDNGHVGLMWYGTNVTANSPDNFAAFANAQWKVYYSTTPDALATSPTFYQVVASGGSDLPNGVVHIGAICTEGTACPSGTRNLAEYSSFTIDGNGMPNFVFSTDVNTSDGAAMVDYVKQLAGPSLFGPSLGRITGQGFFVSNGAKDHFGFRIDSTSQGISGKLAYLDTGANVMISGTSFNSLTINGNSATVSGTGTLNDGRLSTPITFSITVTGNQDPAKGQDYFSISTSGGYSASGYIEGGQIVVTSSS